MPEAGKLGCGSAEAGQRTQASALTDVTTTVAHVGGRRTLFIPDLTGARAPWDRVIAQVANPSTATQMARSATATVRRFDPGSERIFVDTVDIAALTLLSPDLLLDVRRPVSYQGMTNYSSTLCVPTRLHPYRSVWCESFNEQGNYRDMLLATHLCEFATQMLRLEWVLPGGIRVHYPDAMVMDTGGAVTLVDVTTRHRLENPRVEAIFSLTRATCEALGWAYELRTEVTAQRTRNVNALWSRRLADPGRAAAWCATAATVPLPIQFHILARRLGVGTPEISGVLHLLATRRLFVDLDAPIRPDTLLYASPRRSRPAWPEAT